MSIPNWIIDKQRREQEKEWRFPSGARIEFGYADNMTDALRYQGQSYTWIGIDELPQYPPPVIFNFLRSSLRSVDPTIPVYLRATGNPGNVGSLWVKEMFVDPSEPNKAFDVHIDTIAGKKSITRRFIPAKLQDNPYLMQTDDYMIMLSSLPEVQRKQFLDGDWESHDHGRLFQSKRFPASLIAVLGFYFPLTNRTTPYLQVVHHANPN